MAEASRAGVRRVVQLTGSSAGVDASGNAIARLRWRDQITAGDTVTAPFADHRSAVLYPADIGDVAAAALLTDRYAGHVLPLTGLLRAVPATGTGVSQCANCHRRHCGRPPAIARASKRERKPATCHHGVSGG